MSEQVFNQEQVDLINDISNIAIQNVCQALASLMTDEVLLRSILPIQESHLKEYSSGKDVYIIQTDIIGDFKAHTYLVINDAAEKKICEKLLPASELGNQMMREAIMMEMDNIMIAAFVTKYANLFNNSIYGHVPELKKITKDELIDFVKSQSEDASHIYAMTAEMTTFKSRIPFDIICTFDKSLVPYVENFDMSKAFVGKEEDKDKDGKDKKGGGFMKKLFG